MTQKVTSMVVEEGLWRAFRAECVRQGVSASYVLRQLIERQLADWQAGTASGSDAGVPERQRQGEGHEHDR